MSDDTSAIPNEPTTDAAFLDVDEADVETSAEEGHHVANGSPSPHAADVGPGTDDEDTTISRLTDALDSNALASDDSHS